MKIRKKEQSVGILGKILNLKNNSKTDTYSANYLNDRLVKVSPTEPETGEEVWIQKGKNLLNPNIIFSDTNYYKVNQDKSVEVIGFDGSNVSGKNSVKLAKGTYTLSCFDRNNAYLQLYNITANLPISDSQSDVHTFTLEEDSIVVIKVYTEDISAFPFTIHIMLEEGNVATEYEPFIDKKVYLKNDDGKYEEFIKNRLHVGINPPENNEDMWIKASVNKFNKDSMNIVSAYDTSLSVLPTGVRATLNKNTTFRYGIVKLDNSLLGKKISISAKIQASGNNKGHLAIYYGTDTNPVITNTEIGLSESGSTTGTLSGTLATNCTGLYLFLYSNTNAQNTSEGDYVDYTDLQIEVGEPTEYQPYVVNNILTNHDGQYKDFIRPFPLLNFSTEEQVIGTWIDGRKLYMRTFNLGKMANGETKVYETGLPPVHIYWWHTAFVARDSHPGWPYNFDAHTSIDNYNIKIKCDADYTAYNGYTTLIYTKI